MNTLKTWADLANRYSLVLFNDCYKLNDGAVFHEWMESHTCDAQDAQHHMDECETDACKTCKEHINDYGEYAECNCEPLQWYAIAVSESTSEWLNEEYNLDIFFSDTLGIHLLPVYHFGTSWAGVDLK